MTSHIHQARQLITADALSCSPQGSTASAVVCSLQDEAECLLESCVAMLPASTHRLNEFCEAKASDPVYSNLIDYCKNGWPSKWNVPLELKPYWQARGHLTLHKNLVLYGPRIVIPKVLQREILSKIHEGHQGIQKCRLRANISVWWPGITKQIKDMIENCPTCVRVSTPKREPLLPTDLPDYTWQKIGTDLFFLNGANYLIAVYFSRYIEDIKLKTTTSQTIIEGLKSTWYPRNCYQ